MTAASSWGYPGAMAANSGASRSSAGTCFSYSRRVIRVSAGSPPAYSNRVGSAAGAGSRNSTYQCMPLQNGLFCE